MACTRDQEAQAYVYFEDGFDSLSRLNELSLRIPIHVVYATQATLMSAASMFVLSFENQLTQAFQRARNTRRYYQSEKRANGYLCYKNGLWTYGESS